MFRARIVFEGGNGDKSCSGGFTQTRYSKFYGCFAGELLDKDPIGGCK